MHLKKQGRSVDPESLRGKLVVFEGADGAGKTTLATAMETFLVDAGVECVRCAFPGMEAGTVGHLVYRIHHGRADFGISHLTETSLQALHVAAHVDAIETRILPAMAAGSCVLLDRFWWSTWVYGRVGGIPLRILTPLIRFEKAVWGTARPEAVVHLVKPVCKSPTLAREYDGLAAREARSVRIVRIDVVGGVEETLLAATQALGKRDSSVRRSRGR